jgi:hypothetical protein
MTKMTKLILSTVLSIYAPPLPTPDKGDKNASRARTRGNLGITLSDKVARGRARRVSITDHSRGRARRINNISKEPQQKGGLKTICSDNILIVNVLF